MAVSKRLSRRALALFVLFVTVVVYAVNLQLAKTEFTVLNQSAETVVVTANWQQNQQQLGELAPQQQVSFSLEESTMVKLRASYGSGRITTATVPSFQLGSKIVATIRDREIDIQGQ
ncbi:hypothetical protein [Motilimonas eburnea]|uniref:hypothetical protein n=1 Tax=Motilimonas eburnea TaxID=1737488 RepID=UPI001E3E3B0D|nr:hypothetical protein [Motilimonas eburnea]MCE2573130.1 hypothetical protein [Motilimonas eburnea]